MTEILEELPRLTAEERDLLAQKLGELALGDFEETPEMLAAIDEADASPRDQDISAEELLRKIGGWANSK